MKYIIMFVLIGFSINSSSQDSKSTTKTSQNVDSLYCMKIEFKDKPVTYKVGKYYWFKIITRIDKSKIIVTSNNGKVFISKDKLYDYLIIPSTIGQLTLRFYESKNGIKTEISNFELEIDK